MFENYTDSLRNNKIVLKIQQRFKRDHRNVYTENINKIALSSNDDKRLQIFDKTTTYPHGTNAFKVCEIEMLMFMKYKHFVPIETNRICKTIVAKCILNKSIIFCKGKLFSVMKYKDFLLDNKNDIEKTDRISKAINAKCVVNRSIKFYEK